MTHWFRRADADRDDWGAGGDWGAGDAWFETGQDGTVVRQASFTGADGPCGAASVAASRDELTWVRDEFGSLGAQLYEVRYGVLAEGPAPVGEPVSEADFENAWGRARHSRNTSAVETHGPLPHGARLTGTVSDLPWGPGRTGLFVDLGLPIAGFVDLGHLPLAPEDWPDVGTVAGFEVTTVRFGFESGATPQIRLRPTAAPPPGRPWPRPGRP